MKILYRVQTFFHRWGPALLLMTAIFLLSNTPAAQVSAVSTPLIQRISSPRPLGAVPLINRLHIEWLKVGHVVGYALLGLAFLHAFQGHASPRPLAERREAPALLGARAMLFALLACALYALTDEFHQSFIPGRGAALADVALDTLAAAGMLVAQGLVKIAIRKQKPPCSKRQGGQS